MHEIDIAESFTSPRGDLFIVSTKFPLGEAFHENIPAQKKDDLWKTIIKKHRIGVYLILKKYQKRRYSLAMREVGSDNRVNPFFYSYFL